MIGGWELVLLFVALVVLSGTALGIIIAAFIVKRSRRKAAPVPAQQPRAG